jgi:hypothetical protein
MTSKLLVPFIIMAVQMIIDSHAVGEYERTFLPPASIGRFVSNIMDFEAYASYCIYE